MCLAPGGVGGERIGLGFTNPGGTYGKLYMCLCFLCGVGGGGQLGPGGWCSVL